MIKKISLIAGALLAIFGIAVVMELLKEI